MRVAMQRSPLPRQEREIAAHDHGGGAVVYEAMLHARRSKQGRRGFHGERFVAQESQPLALAEEHRFFHLVPVDRCRCTGCDSDVTRGQRARSGIPAYDRSAQHARRYLNRGPVKVID